MQTEKIKNDSLIEVRSTVDLCQLPLDLKLYSVLLNYADYLEDITGICGLQCGIAFMISDRLDNIVDALKDVKVIKF